MIEAGRAGEAPATARYYREAVEQIVQCVEEAKHKWHVSSSSLFILKGLEQ